MATSKTYRTKFYLRNVTVNEIKMVAEVEPISPYLFRIREKEFYGIFRHIPDDGSNDYLDSKMIRLKKQTLSSGEDSWCFKLEIEKGPSGFTLPEVTLVGKSADSIVEIEFKENGSGKLKVFTNEVKDVCAVSMLHETLEKSPFADETKKLIDMCSTFRKNCLLFSPKPLFIADLISVKIG